MLHAYTHFSKYYFLGASNKNIKCKSKKNSTSEIDHDEEEGGSNHNNRDEEEVFEKKKSKRCTGKQDKVIALIVGRSKKGIKKCCFAQQIEVLKESPFADLFMMIMENEYTTARLNNIDEAFTKLLMCLKEATGKGIKFEFVRRGDQYTMTSTPEKVAVILGVPCIKGRWKETKKAMHGDSFRESEFYIRYFDAIFKLLKKTEPPLTRRDNEDLVMLIGLFMCNTIFFTTKDAGAIKEKYLGLVQDFNKCKTLSWVHLIHSELAKRLNKSFNNPIKISRCVFYLPIWFAEQTKIVKPIELKKENFVPRASRWNLMQIFKEFLKDMNTSNYMFRENFFDEITQNERVALGMSEEGGSISLNLIANNEEVHPKMQEIFNKLYFQSCPEELEILPNSFELKNVSDSTEERESKNDTTPAAMMVTTSNDACVTPAEDLQDGLVNVQSNKATTDNSFERYPINDFITCSMSDLSPLPSQEKKVELVFDEGVLEDNIEHEKLHNFTQLDDTEEVVENMTLANILITMKVYCIVFFFSFVLYYFLFSSLC
ncbi:hypothetical protein MKX03_008687 [Papaver bracteatum]|nr:hypothetical protein MKX03_008687 [Papaver bracteatum]